MDEGTDPFAEDLPAIPVPESLRSLLEQGLTNPALPGSFSADIFTYDSGTDQQRPEYIDEIGVR